MHEVALVTSSALPSLAIEEADLLRFVAHTKGFLSGDLDLFRVVHDHLLQQIVNACQLLYRIRDSLS